MIIEGKFNKGGRNKKPSCPRPIRPPKGQGKRRFKREVYDEDDN